MKISTKARAAGLVTAGVVAGGVLAGTLAANAASGTSSGTVGSGTVGSGRGATPSYGAPAMPGGTHAGMSGRGPGPGGASPVRSDEKLVTGSDLTTLKAEALKAVPGGTVIRIETDAGDGAYEAHMMKADSTVVTVKFDKNLAVTKVEQGMGQGDPAPAGAPLGPTGSSGTTTG